MSLTPAKKLLKLLFICLFVPFHLHLCADPIHFNLESYQTQEGLEAKVIDEQLEISWLGENNLHLYLKFSVENGKPIIKELSYTHGEDKKILITNAQPEFRVVSGTRRVTQQQTRPLNGLGVDLTEEVLNQIKWHAFWDAPLYTSDEPPRSHQTSIPAAEPFANHPGMPRKQEEITRSKAIFATTNCEVKTNGKRLEIIFDGVSSGHFQGYIQFDIFKGSNLLRQTFMAKTEKESLAFKYDAGLEGLNIGLDQKIVWRDLISKPQQYLFGSPAQNTPVILKSSNRMIATESSSGSVALFPPPHSFYWARESEQNLGYVWYQKNSESLFSIGIRQAEQEEDPEFYHNFALYNARPGEWQRMPLFIYVSVEDGEAAIKQALRFTNGDKFKPLEGYKVFGSHYHVGLLQRLEEKGGYHQSINDIGTMKSVGVDIYGVIDGVRGKARHDRGEAFLETLDGYYEAARNQSDKDFLVMPNDENSTGSRPPFIGGHYDMLISKPLYWRPGRSESQPLYESHSKYGRVYNLGTASDLMAMTELENVLISMPHPRSKGSTGFPDSIKNTAQFLHENYFALGYRWGMGIDGSEVRLGESRFLPLWDEASNWMVKKGRKPKYALAISEARSDIGERGKPSYDDTYGMSPVNYIKLDKIPQVDDMSPVINALKKGDFFVTSGEVLIPEFSLTGSGNKRKIVAMVEWTFPLDFVEIVWGDGDKVNREIISTTDLEQFGKKTFEISFNPKGKKWVRFAAWDVAANGALVQPIHLDK